MFIDIHTHAYRLKTMTSMHTPDQLLKRMDELKIDMAVLLPFVNAEIYFTQQVEDIVEMAQQSFYFLWFLQKSRKKRYLFHRDLQNTNRH
jgi:hypothetical protein